MAVVVEVLNTQPAQDWPSGQKTTGYITVSVSGDYLSPAPLQTQMIIQFIDQPSRQAAIEHCLHRVVETAEQMKDGALQAASQHPAGG